MHIVVTVSDLIFVLSCGRLLCKMFIQASSPCGVVCRLDKQWLSHCSGMMKYVVFVKASVDTVLQTVGGEG